MRTVDSEYEWLRKKGYNLTQCETPSLFDSKPNLSNRYEEYICIFKRLRLKPYMFKKMFKEFTRADKDNSGALSIEEFFGTFELTFVTPLAKRAFYSFDLDDSGELDYGEFTVMPVMSNFAHAQLLLESIIYIFFKMTGVRVEFFEHNDGRPWGILFRGMTKDFAV